MRLKLIYIALIALMTACGSGTEKANEVDIKVRDGDAGFREKESNPDTIRYADPKQDPSIDNLEAFVELYSTMYDSARASRMILVERFGALQKQKFGLRRKQSIVLKNDTILFQPSIDVWTMEYRDSSQMTNVIRNWFMEFGSGRKEVTVGVDTPVESFPMHAIINERQIAIISVPCSPDTCFNRKAVIENFSQLYKDDKSTILDVDCHNNLRWLQFSLPKEEEIQDSTANKNTPNNI